MPLLPERNQRPDTRWALTSPYDLDEEAPMREVEKVRVKRAYNRTGKYCKKKVV